MPAEARHWLLRSSMRVSVGWRCSGVGRFGFVGRAVDSAVDDVAAEEATGFELEGESSPRTLPTIRTSEARRTGEQDRMMGDFGEEEDFRTQENFGIPGGFA